MRCVNRKTTVIAWTMAVALLMFGSIAGYAQTYEVLYSMTGSDGLYPNPLAIDSHGNLVGTAMSGGGYPCYEDESCGTVFELSPLPGNQWAFSVLHYFEGAADGGFPTGPLAIDQMGNLYGSGTWQGGNVFQVSHSPSGSNLLTIFGQGTTPLVLHGSTPR